MNENFDIFNKPKPKFCEKFLSQDFIKQNVNLYVSDKAYDLNLSQENIPGPFFNSYSLDGSSLLIYNKKGYFASFNTNSIRLNFENSVNSIEKALFLHNENYVAVAEKSLFIYNNKTEIHSVNIPNIKHMAFLPYHFLLSAYSNKALQYLDTSIGEVVGKIKVTEAMGMCQNKGVVYLGHSNGSVTLHSPKQEKYLMKINCSNNILDLKINEDFLYVTSFNSLRLFDQRNTFKPYKVKKLNKGYKFNVSGNNCVGLYNGNNILFLDKDLNPYLKHKTNLISEINFNPFVDICTLSTTKGINNIIIPGSSDPNIDSCENSPFLSKREKKNLEVKKLLEKIPPELISYKGAIGLEEKEKKYPEEKKRYFEEKKEEIPEALKRFY